MRSSAKAKSFLVSVNGMASNRMGAIVRLASGFRGAAAAIALIEPLGVKMARRM
jgi:hypothetical protein